MSKKRLVYTIFSLLLVTALIGVSLVFPKYYFLILLVMILIIVPARKMKRNENQVKMNILFEYSHTCNTEKYINETRKVNKTLVLSRSDRFIEEVNIGLALIGAGEFEKVEELIVRLSKEQSKVNDIAILFYLRMCTDYFFYANKPDEIKVVYEKIKTILDNSKPNIQMNFSIVSMICEAKKNILNNENLEQMKKFYETLKMPPTTLNLLSKEYVLAIIDMKLKDFDSAINRLNKLAEKKYDLIYVKNAKNLLEKLKQKDVE